MVGMTRPGAFAEYMSIPASSLIALPETIDSNTAALTEPAATAVHALDLSVRALRRPIQECRVLVVGGGAIGMFTALLLKHFGVLELDVIEVNPLRRQTLARETQCKVIDPAAEHCSENHYELVVDCVGSAVTRSTAFQAIRPGGVIMHVGLQEWASEIDMRKLTLAEITLLGTYTYTTVDLKNTVRYLDRGVFGPCSWVDLRSLEEGPAAFADLHYGRAASAKILLKPFSGNLSANR
jgi:alcohol dehydrogenase